MITVRRGKETTAIQLDGDLRTLLLESISVIQGIRSEIDKRVEDPEVVIYHWVYELIDAAYGK